MQKQNKHKNNTYAIKQLLFKAYGKECMLCGSVRNLQAHHIRRRSAGGEDSFDNLAIVCKQCHEEIHQSTENENFYGVLLKLLKLRKP